MQIDLSYFVVNKSHILALTDESTYKEFLDWNNKYGDFIRLPWGDLVSNIEGYVVEYEDFEEQEEVFNNCSLEIQNLIYQLKQIQLKENPSSKANLVFQ
jgi:hypothetical protein